MQKINFLITGLLYISIIGTASPYNLAYGKITEKETLYVRYNLNTGANDGTNYQNAFRSFSDVLWSKELKGERGKVGPGDTLYICGGPYDEQLIVKASGTSHKPIILDGKCSNVNVNYADGVIGRLSLSNAPSAMTNGAIIKLYNSAYITIQNLSFKNPFGVRQKSWTWRAGAGKHNGGDGSDILIDEPASWGNTIKNGWVGGVVFNMTTGAKGIITANTRTTVTAKMTGGKPDNLWHNGDRYKITVDSGQIWLSGKTHHIAIQSNTFDSSAANAGFAIMLSISSKSEVHHITIDNNIFHGSEEVAIWAYYTWKSTGIYHDITISNNTGTAMRQLYYGRSRPSIDPDGDGSTDDDRAPYGFNIHNNTIEIGDGGHNFVSIVGMHKVAGSGYNSIRNNTITTVGVQTRYTNLFQIHWAKDLIIEGNIIEGPYLMRNCDGCAIIIDWAYGRAPQKYISDGIIIRNNIVYDAYGSCPGKAISVYRGRNIKIYNNLLYHNNIGIKISGQNVAGYETDNIEIYNNTVVNSIKDGILINRYTTNVKLKNNILSRSGDDGIDDNSGNIDSSNKDYNLIYASGNTNCESSSCGANTIIGRDPLLDAEYNLGRGSPAINAGDNSAAQDTSIICDEIIDIGFKEYCKK